MKKWAVLLIAAVSSLGADAPGGASIAKEKSIKEEIARLQGSWQMVSAIRDGSTVPDARIKKTKAEIKGDSITVTFGSWTLAKDVKFEIDPTSKPKWMTELVADGWDKGKQNRGIYTLEGDRLTICIAATGKARPSEFASKAGSGTSLRVFRKSAAKK